MFAKSLISQKKAGTHKTLWYGACVALTLVLSAPHTSHAESEGDANAAPAAPAVTVAVAKKRDFRNAVSFNGRIEAIESADLQARVQGYLQAKHFDEGTIVEKGTLLFELDKATFVNALDRAKAALEVAKANQTLYEQKFDRQSELTERNVQSKAALEEAQANLDISIANVAAAKAVVDEAQINLDYTTIEAPFTGLIGRAAVSTGDLISPLSGTMVSIVQSDPIYISFPVPQSTLLEVRKSGEKKEDVLVELTLADGSVYEHKGKISFPDVSATSSTDTIIVRATVENPDSTLIDKGLVDVTVVANQDASVLAIPQQALLLDQQGPYVLIVDDNDTVQRVQVEEGQQQSGYLEIKSGIKAGARVIIDGIQKARPGTKVAASAASATN